MEEPCNAVQRVEGQVAAPWRAQMQHMQQQMLQMQQQMQQQQMQQRQQQQMQMQPEQVQREQIPQVQQAQQQVLQVQQQVLQVQQQMLQMQQQMQQQMLQMQQQMQQQMRQTTTPQHGGSGGQGRRRDGAALLAVLLEHPAVHGDQAVLCRLLASSRQAAVLAARHCAGRLDARVCLTSVEEAEVAAAWLTRRAPLLRSLALRPYFELAGDAAALNAAACAVLASGLRQAEWLMPGSLSRLRSFSCRGLQRPSAPLLEALAPALGSLTRLELSACGDCLADRDLPAVAIARLTALRHLELHAGIGFCRCDNAAALAGLPHVTRLASLDVEFLPLDVRRLPSSLEHLELAIKQESSSAAVDLGHLTRLTELNLCDNVRQDAVLPPSLAKLSTRELESLEPLLHLTALRRLDAEATPEQAAELSRRLPALDNVCIRRCVPFPEEDYMDVLQARTVGNLRDFGLLLMGREWAAALQHLSRLTGLTALELDGDQDEVAAGPLAAVLGALPQLRQLTLNVYIDWEAGGADGAAAAASAAGSSQARLMRAVVQLPELRSFVCWPGVNGNALAELSAAVRLTSLMFAFLGVVSGAVLAPVLLALTALESLVLPDAVVEEAPVFEALCGLRRLTSLSAPGVVDDLNTPRRLWASLPELAELDCW